MKKITHTKNYSHITTNTPLLRRGIKGEVLLVLLLITSSLISQEIKNPPAGQVGGEVYSYARKIVDTMASESMHGRGYVNGGDSIAANYIKTEFKKFGLKSFGDDYYQRFSFAVNTFPDTILFGFMKAAILEKHKKSSTIEGSGIYCFKGLPGKNYLIDASSLPCERDDFIIYVFDSTNASSEKKFKKFEKDINNSNGLSFVLVDDRKVFDKKKLKYFKQVKSNCFNFYGVIELVNRLTWDQSQFVSKPKIQILSDSFKYDDKVFLGKLKIDSKFIPNHPSQNVIGYVKGSVYPDSFIVYTAHYDHLGQMGKAVYFPGANDNASGSAMLLNLARYYSMPEHQPKYSIAFMSFCAEEVGLLGSQYYTEHPLFPLKNIKFVLNMDIMGTGEEGITVVNGSVFKKEFDKLKEINTQNNFIKDVKIRGKAANSDHYLFSEKGVKAFFIYTMGGIKAYHDIYDRAETLPLNEFENLFKLITSFGDYLQN